MDDLVIICNDNSRRPLVTELAAATGRPICENISVASLEPGQVALIVNAECVYLQQGGDRAPGPVKVEFVQGKVGFRRRQHNQPMSLICKAAGVKASVKPSIFDVTAGFGQDGFELAAMGCDVTLVERNPIVFAMLADGLRRAREHAGDEHFALTLNRLSLIQGDALEVLATLSQQQRPQVIVMDPMFPVRSKSAKVKKNMQLFHRVVGSDDDADRLLNAVLAAATHRVVVKRPLHAPHLGTQKPAVRMVGKTIRFDVYPLQKIE